MFFSLEFHKFTEIIKKIASNSNLNYTSFNHLIFDQVKEDEVGRACSTNGGEEEGI
jgi:hypothetical protein